MKYAKNVMIMHLFLPKSLVEYIPLIPSNQKQRFIFSSFIPYSTLLFLKVLIFRQANW